jgi:hypothetical protein
MDAMIEVAKWTFYGALAARAAMLTAFASGSPSLK